MSSTSHKTVYDVSEFSPSSARKKSLSASHSPVSERHAQPPHRMSRGISSDSVSSLNRRTRSDTDIVILVMGMTGSGKSTFINSLAEEEVEVGHSLHSSTAEVRLASFLTVRGRAGFLIDTPGFDDTNRSDTEILKEIAAFLAKLYREGTYVTGIIYMHRITDVRMQGSAIKNLEVFRRLCGEQCFPQVALVSTMWQTLKGPEGEKIGRDREAELKSKKEFWGGLTARGSRTFRYYDDLETATPIIKWFLNMPNKLRLNIQEEMVDDGLSLDQTEAGEYLGKDFAKLKRRYEQEIKELASQVREAQEDDDGSMKDFLISQQRDFKSKLADTQQTLQDLRVDLRELALQKAPEYAARILQMEMEQRIEVEEEGTSVEETELQKLENHIDLLERDRRHVETQKEQEIEMAKRLDRARANEVINQLEKKYNERLRQLVTALHSEQQKRRDAEAEAERERLRRQPRRLEFMKRHFGRDGRYTDGLHGATDRSIVISSRWVAVGDDRHALTPLRRATTWEQQQPAIISRPLTMPVDYDEEDPMNRPLRRTRTGDERRVKTPPRSGLSEGSRHLR